MRSLLIVSLALAAGGNIHAQTPGAPSAPDTTPRTWLVGIDFGFNFASGNSNFSVLNTALRVNRKRSELAEFEWSAGIEYGRDRGVVREKRISSGAKFDYLPERTISPFTFVNAEQDEARKIDLQAYGGAGIKYTFWKGASGKASISAAMVYNYETFNRATLVIAPNERTTRWSLRFKAARKFGAGLQLENTSFYQPVLDVANDYNINATTAVTSKATSHLSLFIRHLYRRDSTPVLNVKPVDQRVTAGLRMEF